MIFRLYIFTILLLMLACNPDRHRRSQPTGPDIKESLINANRIMMENENHTIDSIVSNSNFDFQNSGSGLRYHIIEKGIGSMPQEDDTVSVSYTVHLLNSELIDEKKVSDNFRWIIGKSDVLRGMEEGVSMLGTGGKITLIVPSHLAYGRFGDNQKVPGSTPVMVTATLHKISKAKS